MAKVWFHLLSHLCLIPSARDGWLLLTLLVSGFGPCSSKSGQGYPSSNETHGPKPMSNKLAEKPRGNYRGKSGLLVRCRISSINSMECKSHGILWLHGSSTCNGLLKSGGLPWRLISTYGNRPAWEGIKYIPHTHTHTKITQKAIIPTLQIGPYKLAYNYTTNRTWIYLAQGTLGGQQLLMDWIAQGWWHGSFLKSLASKYGLAHRSLQLATEGFRKIHLS